jgi:regulator of replication initiation timing
VSKRDTDNLATMAADLEAENARLRAEVAKLQEIFDEAVRHCRTGEQVALDTIVGLETQAMELRAQLATLAAENASLRERGRAAEAERDQARQERDETIADYYEDLADCLRTVVAERDQFKRDLDRAQARVNRMAATAPLDDVNWRPERCVNS